VDAVLPSNLEVLEELFLGLKKYTALLQNHSCSNSAKTIVKVLNILLENPLFFHAQPIFSDLCSQHVSTLYPIICRLFQQNRPPVYYQGITVLKVVGEDALDAVHLLVNFLKVMQPTDLRGVLDNIQEDLWFILMLWLFDCT